LSKLVIRSNVRDQGTAARQIGIWSPAPKRYVPWVCTNYHTKAGGSKRMIAQNIGTVAVLGASGRLGRLVVQSLLANGLRVKALVHRHPLELNDSGLVAVPGSVHDLEDFEIGSEHPYLISRRNSLMPFMSGLILDGEAQMRTLSDSDLAWTVIRLPRMLFDDRRSILLRSAPAASGETVGYAQAASAIVDELVRPQWIAQAPFAVPS
jgi:hypothetical protein